MKSLLKQRLAENKIDTFLFDLDGTLYSSTAGIEFSIKPMMRKVLSEKLNISVEDAHAILWNILKENDKEAAGLSKLGIDLKDYYFDVYKSLDLSNIQPYLGLFELFESLKVTNIKTFVLTNSSRIHAERVLDMLKILDHIDLIVGFEDNDYTRKPDRHAYKSLITKTNIKPSRTVYFDDSLPNLYTAHQLGFNTIIVSNGLAASPYFMEMHYKVRHEIPDFVDWHSFDIVATLNQLLNLLNNGHD